MKVIKLTSGIRGPENWTRIDSGPNRVDHFIVFMDSKLCSPILVLTLYSGGSLFDILDNRDSRSFRFRFVRRISSGRIFSISSGVSDNDERGDVVV